MAFWSENVGVFSSHKLFRTRFCCTSTRALSFGLIYLQTMRQACCWQADMFGVTCHPVLLQVLIYHHDVLHSFTVCLIKFKHCLSQYVLSAFLWINLFFPRFLKKTKRKKCWVSYPRYLSPFFNLVTFTEGGGTSTSSEKMVGRSKGGFASPTKKYHSPEIYSKSTWKWMLRNTTVVT